MSPCALALFRLQLRTAWRKFTHGTFQQSLAWGTIALLLMFVLGVGIQSALGGLIFFTVVNDDFILSASDAGSMTIYQHFPTKGTLVSRKLLKFRMHSEFVSTPGTGVTASFPVTPSHHDVYKKPYQQV